MQHTWRGVRSLVVAVAIVGAAHPISVSFASAVTRTAGQPVVTLGYGGSALKGFVYQVTGQDFTAHGPADVLILENGQVLQHDVVGVSAQGTFTDTTALACDFQTHEARAYDRRSGHWSNLATLGGTCPG